MKTKIKSGDRFGLWTVIDIEVKYFNEKRKTYAKCVCDCGTERLVETHRLPYSGSCGCSARKLKVGDKYGRLTVTRIESGKIGRNSVSLFAICVCDCGNVKRIKSDNLRYGRVVSCGCYRNEKIKELWEKNKTHGLSRTWMYSAWYGMMHRCYNVNNIEYNNYGGRGIRVCIDWHDIDNFVKFICKFEYKPGLSIDRINNDGDYEPGNVKLSNAKEQANNRRSNNLIEYNGIVKNVSGWADFFGIKRDLLAARLHRGVPFGKAIFNGRLNKNAIQSG